MFFPTLSSQCEGVAGIDHCVDFFVIHRFGTKIGSLFRDCCISSRLLLAIDVFMNEVKTRVNFRVSI